MKRLYLWFSERASFFHAETSGRGTSRTVRTEVTIRREGMTLQVNAAAAATFETCPLCGTELVPPSEFGVTGPEGSATPKDIATARRLV